MRRHLPKLILAWLFSSIVSVPLSTNLLVTSQLAPRLRAKRAAEFAPRAEQIRADLELVAQAPPFAAPGLARNADPLFRANVEYEREGTTARSPRAALELIDQKFPRWRTHEDDVRRLLDDVLLNAVDTAWIRDLSSYDHWSPYREVVGSGGLARAAAFLALPRPNYAQVRDVTLLHLLQSAKRGDAAAGLARLHHVAALAGTSGAQDGHAVATSLLQLEGGFAQAFGVVRPPVREDVLEAYSRLGAAWVQIARLTQTQDAGFDAFLKPETGACAAAGDVALGLGPFADYLAPRAPFESDFGADLARDRRFREKLFEVCGLRELNALVRDQSKAGWWQYSVRTPAGATRAMPNFARIPFVRRVIGLYLLLAS